MTVWTKNFQSDYSAPCNGVDSDVSAFDAFRTFALSHPGDEFVLQLPAAGTVLTSTVGSNGNGNVFDGITSKLTVEGNGCSWTGTVIGLGSGGVATSDALATGFYGAYTEDAGTGDSTVTLLGSSDQIHSGLDTTLFSPGSVAIMAGGDLQGEGYPPSPVPFEYVTVVSVDSGAKTVTFTPPLTKIYKKRWPNFTLASQLGGPATLFRTTTGWDTEFIINDVHFIPVTLGQEIGTSVRTITLNNVICDDAGNASGIFASASENATWNNCTFYNIAECDKLVKNFTINGGTFTNPLFQSSSSGDNLVINDAIITTLSGTSRTAELHRNTIGTLAIGPAGYGATDSLLLDSNVISAVLFVGSYDSTIDDGSNSMTSGVITAAKTSTPLRQNTIPGNNYAWASLSGGTLRTLGPYTKVTDYSDIVAGAHDADNVTITTDQVGGFPTVAGVPSAELTLRSLPVQQSFSATGNTGCAQVVDWSQAGAQNKPLGSYSHRVVSASTFISGHDTLEWIFLLGKVVSIVIDVTRAYSGANGTAGMRLRGSGDTNYFVDLKTTGTRTITPTTVTGDVGADSLIPAGTDWFFDGNVSFTSQPLWYFPDMGAEASGLRAEFTITITTDQGFSFPDPTPPSVTPLGRLGGQFRFH